MRELSRWQIALVVLLACTYVSTRFWGLTDSCLWFDEIYSVHAAQHTIAGLVNFVSLDLIHPPLFYLILKGWLRWGGESLFWVRLLPAIIGALAMIPLYGLLRELNMRWRAICISLCLFTVNGALLKYCQEVRMYSLLLTTGLVSLWVFARYLRNCRGIVLLILINVVLAFTHYFGWLLIAGEILYALVWARDRFGAVVLGSLAVAVAFVPWIVVVGAAASEGGLAQNIGWMSRPGIGAVSVLVFDLIEPFYAQAVSSQPSSYYIVTVPLLILYITSCGLAVAGRRQVLTSSVRYLIFFGALPIGCAFVASWLLPYSIWGTRHLILAFPPLTLLAACVIDGSEGRATMAILACLGLLLLTAGVLKLSQGRESLSWCVAGTMATQAVVDKEVNVYAAEDLVAYQLWHDLESAHQDRPRVYKIENIPDAREDKAYFIPRGFDEITRVDLDQIPDPRFLLVLRMNRFDHDASLLVELQQRGFTLGEPSVTEADDAQVIEMLVFRQ